MRDPLLTSEFFTKHRQQFINGMDKESVAVFHAATPVIRSADQFYQYHQTSGFFYLTGIEQPNCVLMLHPENAKGKTETLFIPEPDPEREVWDGKMLDKETAEEISGIEAENIQWKKSFEHAFIRAQENADTLYADYDDMGLKYSTSKNGEFLTRVQQGLPGLRIRKANGIMHRMRRVKSPEEIQLIEKAIEITKAALFAIWKHAKPGVMEYELEAHLAYHCIKNNARRFAYKPIIASGINAATLHYIENTKQIEEGELLLTDVGAEYSHYCADITRTIPVDGTFTDRQREVYEAVLDVQQTTLEAVKPGVMMEDLNKQAKDLIGERLIDLELVADKENTGKYYMHSVGHFLGLDTHDVGTYKQSLEPGNVLTVEPGIYIQEEQIGVRIEDNVVVTEDGYRVLSDSIPKEPDTLEDLLTS
ncbi:MAG: Xaa-Pro aminopeptidase [Candidatus Marinimicrobia bacterium]|nr:Xaa-Pro aminopeptidase [Candidatus Neomarinimicrobiota bacterium]